LYLAISSQFSHCSLSVTWTQMFAWTQVTQRCNIALQFSLRSCYGWSHSSHRHIFVVWEVFENNAIFDVNIIIAQK